MSLAVRHQRDGLLPNFIRSFAQVCCGIRQHERSLRQINVWLELIRLINAQREICRVEVRSELKGDRDARLSNLFAFQVLLAAMRAITPVSQTRRSMWAAKLLKQDHRHLVCPKPRGAAWNRAVAGRPFRHLRTRFFWEFSRKLYGRRSFRNISYNDS